MTPPVSLTLDIVLRNEELSLGLFSPGSTVQSYETLHPEWPLIHKDALAIAMILNKAGHLAGQTSGLSSDLKQHGRFLYDHLIPPGIKSRLKAHDGTILLQLTENLVDVPWELIFDGEDFWCLRYPLGRCVKTDRAPVQVAAREIKKPVRLLVIADPQGNLPAARREAKSIRACWEGKLSEVTVTTKTGEVSRHYFLKHLAECDVLHYAGHTSDAPAEQNSPGWAVSDGMITESDFLNQGQNAALPPLIFMNACSSAVVKQDPGGLGQAQVFGLAKVCLLSGSRHIVGSVAPLADEPAGGMAEDFYRNLVAGQSAGESLRLARRESQAKRGADDLSWAGYVLYGDPALGLFVPPVSMVPRRQLAAVIRENKRAFFLAVALGFLALVFGFLANNIFFEQNLRSAQHLVQSGQTDLAVRKYRLALKARPSSTAATVGLARLYRKLAQHDRAIACLESVLRQPGTQGGPAELSLKRLLAEEFLLAGKVSDALAVVETVADEEISLSEKVSWQLLRGAVYSAAGRYREADQAFALSEDACRAQKCPAYLATLTARAEAATVGFFRQTVYGVPEEISGSAVIGLWEKAAASAVAQGALSVEMQALSRLGKIYRQRNDPVKAREYFEKASAKGKSLSSVSDEDSVTLLNLYLDLAWARVEDGLDFDGALAALKSAGDAGAGLAAKEAGRQIAVRRFEWFLQALAVKGYKNSDLYRQAGKVYDRFLSGGIVAR